MYRKLILKENRLYIRRLRVTSLEEVVNKIPNYKERNKSLSKRKINLKKDLLLLRKLVRLKIQKSKIR